MSSPAKQHQQRKKRKSDEGAVGGQNKNLTTSNSFAALRNLKRVKRSEASGSTGTSTKALPSKKSEVVIEIESTHPVVKKRAKADPPAEVVSPPRQRKPQRPRSDVPKGPFLDPKVVSTYKPSSKSMASNFKDLTVAIMQPDETICFHGMVSVAVLSGSVTVYGHRLNADSAWETAISSSATDCPSLTNPSFTPCYSPKTHSLLVIRSQPRTGPSKSHAPPADTKSDASLTASIWKLVADLKTSTHKDSTVIVLKSLAHCGVRGLQNADPVYKGIVAEKTETDTMFIPQFEPIFSAIPNVSALEIPLPWERAADAIVANEDLPAPIMTIVGGSNVGKSTFARFLVNRLLERYPVIAFLEADVGQTEFTSSGLMSLHLIERPLIGPPFTHLRQSYRCLHVGATSSQGNPDYYLACVKTLVQAYQEELCGDAGEAIPLVVNTSGWIRGMGLDLLLSTLVAARPSHVLQMNVSLDAPQAYNKNIQADLHQAISSMTNNALECAVIGIPALDDVTAIPRLGGSDQRTLATLSYFNQASSHPPLWTFDKPITARVPFRVPFKSVRIRFLQGEVPYSQTLRALNGTIVSLLIERGDFGNVPSNPADLYESNTDSEAAPALQIIPSQVTLSPDSHHCVGLGLIRGIDVENEQFLVVTGPIPLALLQQVNTFVRSAGVDMPVSLMMAGYEDIRTPLPYTTPFASEGVGSLAWRTRRNLMRRRGQPQ
ncbi:Pre-mRNA cleavage complex II protein Clp1-domain-containing protein [Phlyctochytrium arcticum]|nr:Pre-mRNA cleavage complex II protein Clp1-domain-containing protein [Phlyctochytrium arcticum]